MRRSRVRRPHEGGNVLKGLAAGLIGGLVASYVMNQFQSALGKLSESGERGQQKSEQEKKQSRKDSAEPDDATVKTASAISEDVFDHELTKSEKKVAGPAVHYAFGTTMGGLYGATTELMPGGGAGTGLLFGTVVWLGADEAALPLLGLSKAPTEYPLSTHASALASHFVYGLTAETVRSLVRRAL